MIRRHRVTLLSFPLVIVAAIAVSACVDEPGSFVVRADSAGVEIVQNTREDYALRWRFEERARVSDSLPADPSILGPGHVGADSMGRLYVLDPTRQRIAVFDSTGSFLRAIGGRGGLADGLDTPVSMTVRPGGVVEVFDMGLARLLEFTLEGEVVGQRPLATGEWGWRVRSALDGFVGVRRHDSVRTSDSGLSVRRLVSVMGPDTLELARVRWETATFTLPACGLTATAEPLFSPRLAWDAAARLVVVAAEVEYVVNWFGGAGQTRSIRRPVLPRLTSDSIAAEELGDGPSVVTPTGPCGGNPSDEVRQRGYAPRLPAVSGVLLEQDSTLWVVRGHFRSEDPAVDVFTSGGVYLGTLPAGAPLPVGFSPAGDVLAVERGPDDTAELVRYAVDRRR